MSNQLHVIIAGEHWAGLSYALEAIQNILKDKPVVYHTVARLYDFEEAKAQGPHITIKIIREELPGMQEDPIVEIPDNMFEIVINNHGTLDQLVDSVNKYKKILLHKVKNL
jgi:hypothetical protein